MTQIFTGVLPGAGLALATATFDPIRMGGFCYDAVYLGCCPTSVALKFTTADAAVYQAQAFIGSTGFHYDEEVNRSGNVDFSGSTRGRVVRIDLVQVDGQCTGEPYELKIGLIVSDFASAVDTSCVCGQTCGAIYSYVQIW